MNNKAFTTIEVIFTFALVTIIVFSIFTVTLSYRDRFSRESAINQLLTYKKTLSKIIYDDVFGDNLTNISRCTIPDSESSGGFTTTYHSCFNIYSGSKVYNLLTVSKEGNGQVEKYIFYNGVKYVVPESEYGHVNFQVASLVEDSAYKIYLLKIPIANEEYDYNFEVRILVANG